MQARRDYGGHSRLRSAQHTLVAVGPETKFVEIEPPLVLVTACGSREPGSISPPDDKAARRTSLCESLPVHVATKDKH